MIDTIMASVIGAASFAGLVAMPLLAIRETKRADARASAPITYAPQSWASHRDGCRCGQPGCA